MSHPACPWPVSAVAVAPPWTDLPSVPVQDCLILYLPVWKLRVFNCEPWQREDVPTFLLLKFECPWDWENWSRQFNIFEQQKRKENTFAEFLKMLEILQPLASWYSSNRSWLNKYLVKKKNCRYCICYPRLMLSVTGWEAGINSRWLMTFLLRPFC